LENSLGLQPLRIRKLSSMIEDSIKELVLTGQLKSGDKLPTEKELSVKFGVSIVTVREALRGLEAFGVIEKKRGRDGGVFISSNGDSVKDVVFTFLTSRKFSAKDVSEVRGILQPFSAKLAASRINPDLLKTLEKNIEYCEKMVSKVKPVFTEKEFFEIEERNVEFHRLLGEATGNPILALTVDYVEDFVLSYKKNNLTPDLQHSVKTIGEHRYILECVKKGDADATEKAMVVHLRNIEEYLEKKAK
jgi:GntR family transcriptional regulator, transcriptional repressor for pyruvate dehydrogenase complex